MYVLCEEDSRIINLALAHDIYVQEHDNLSNYDASVRTDNGLALYIFAGTVDECKRMIQAIFSSLAVSCKTFVISDNGTERAAADIEKAIAQAEKVQEAWINNHENSIL